MKTFEYFFLFQTFEVISVCGFCVVVCDVVCTVRASPVFVVTKPLPVVRLGTKMDWSWFRIQRS